MKKTFFPLLFLITSISQAPAETAGAGSYLTVFPGTDKAGRNSYPAGTPYLSGKALGKPAPTNEWYSSEIAKPHGDNIFNYPMALKPIDSGLAMIKNMEYQAIVAENPFVVGVEGISALTTNVSDFSDWTVTIRWESSAGSMEATTGQGMPMVYFTKSAGSGDATITVNSGTLKVIDGNILVVTGGYNRASYAAFAPSGATWTVSGNSAKSSLAGKNYWTVAMLPEGTDVEATAREWKACAFAFPKDTRAQWTYIASAGTVTTEYIIETDVKEGDLNAKPLVGLLPHHWANLQQGNPTPGSMGEFSTVRGSLKLMATDRFVTAVPFTGILAVLPAAQQAASGYDPEVLKTLVDDVCNDTGFSDWTDSYNDGQLLNRLSQTALVARAAGYEEGAEKAVKLLKAQLERWFTASAGDVAFVFYYHEPWNALLAYPAGHGQDSNLNDHNFHYGYFIDAAATVAMFDPSWAEKWGPMVDLLAQDVANTDRQNSRFPYLRSFSPFSGHCWANGLASLSLGNDQESSSESMMSHAALVKWAEVRGNTALRDAAVWMFATELSAVQEYWFDTQGRNRPASFQSALASRVFSNGYDDENFWGGGIAGSYGIQVYPVQPSSTYLVADKAYASKLWNSMCSRTGILSLENNDNIWYDSWAQFLSMIDPAQGLGFYNKSLTMMGRKFGVSHPLTYYWVHSLAVVGSPVFTVSADSPLAQVFENGDARTYAASNYSSTSRKVTFSDGKTLDVPAGTTVFYTDGTPEVAQPDTPATPGGPGEGETGENEGGTTTVAECVETGTEASEGQFKNPYTLGFSTLSNGSVRVTARFEDESAYVGFDGPWLFNETDGFVELRMTTVSPGLYEVVLTGLNPGDEVKVRVKIAFAGGLAVTRQYSYEVGTECSPAGLQGLDSSTALRVGVSEGVINIESEVNGDAYVYGIDGKLAAFKRVESGMTSAISLTDSAAGVYILRIIPEDPRLSPLVKTIIF